MIHAPKPVTIKLVSEADDKDDEDVVRTIAVTSQAHLKELMGGPGGRGLFTLSDQTTLVSELGQLEEGETYYVDHPMLDARRGDRSWRQKEDRAVEDEVTKCVIQEAGERHSGLTIRYGLRDVYRQDCRDRMQEWDGVVANGKVLFLLEVKHGVEAKHLELVKKKKRDFDSARDQGQLPEFKNFDTVFVAVGGTDFSSDLQDECMREGFLVISPSGGRYSMQWNSKLLE
uniref:Uncharacterized protein n=1 Tax=Hemiselmis andersenii TaxID=464988 RepID=A0A6T8MQ18_HEMAN